MDTDVLADDLLWGAEAISVELFGTKKKKRKIYHLHETGQLPTWRHEGSNGKKGPLLARRSELRRTFAGPRVSELSP